MPRWKESKLEVDTECVRDTASQARRGWNKQQLAREVQANEYVIRNARRDLVEQGVSGVDEISDEEMFLIIETARDYADPVNGEFVEDEMVRLVTGE